MSEPTNPYAAPATPLLAPASGPRAEAERIRHEHLKHEASLRSIGLLYYLNGGLLLLGAMALVTVVLLAPPESSELDSTFVIGLSAFYVALGVGVGFVGRGLRALKAWTKLPVGLLSAVGLLGFPLGTLISLYILYLVFSAKGRTVLSSEYAEAIRLTPHIEYRTSILVWIALALILLLLLFAIVAILASS